MNSDQLTQLLQQSFHFTLGATASLVETLQDPQKLDQNLEYIKSIKPELSQLTQTQYLEYIKSELSQITTELAAKGKITEQEARDFVDNFLKQISNQEASSSSATTSTTEATTSSQDAPPEVQLELQELTAQLAAIRAELEKLRSSDSNPS
jgi:polyhydroxyalkanoate synthesis regulator phasin